MTELFLVNMVYRGGNYGGAFKEGDWICFRVQSVLIGTRGQTEVDLAKLN